MTNQQQVYDAVGAEHLTPPPTPTHAAIDRFVHAVAELGADTADADAAAARRLSRTRRPELMAAHRAAVAALPLARDPAAERGRIDAAMRTLRALAA